MSRRGNCHDNAVIESFHQLIKRKCIRRKIYLTRVEAEPEADTFFPEIDGGNWWLSSLRKQEADERNAFAHSFETWEKI